LSEQCLINRVSFNHGNFCSAIGIFNIFFLFQEFLDECLEAENTPLDSDFELRFKYAFLGPPLRQRWKRETLKKKLMDEAGGDNGQEEEADHDASQVNLPESEPLWYLSQSPEHRHLLVHPLISSFLCLKWRKIRPFYYANLIFYLLFVAVTTSYLLLLPEHNDTSWMGGLRWISVAFWATLTLRELFQACVSCRR